MICQLVRVTSVIHLYVTSLCSERSTYLGGQCGTNVSYWCWAIVGIVDVGWWCPLVSPFPPLLSLMLCYLSWSTAAFFAFMISYFPCCLSPFQYMVGPPEARYKTSCFKNLSLAALFFYGHQSIFSYKIVGLWGDPYYFMVVFLWSCLTAWSLFNIRPPGGSLLNSCLDRFQSLVCCPPHSRKIYWSIYSFPFLAKWGPSNLLIFPSPLSLHYSLFTFASTFGDKLLF